MNIKEFVDESLTQILEGITKAQSRNKGMHVAAEAYISPTGNLINGGSSGLFTIVDFDISVAATRRKKETVFAFPQSSRLVALKNQDKTQVE
jgi:hypothetical protein